MENLKLNEVIFIHKAVSEYDIKGADAPFIASILEKLVLKVQNLKEIQEAPEKTKK